MCSSSRSRSLSLYRYNVLYIYTRETSQFERRRRLLFIFPCILFRDEILRLWRLLTRLYFYSYIILYSSRNEFLWELLYAHTKPDTRWRGYNILRKKYTHIYKSLVTSESISQFIYNITADENFIQVSYIRKSARFQSHDSHRSIILLFPGLGSTSCKKQTLPFSKKVLPSVMESRERESYRPPESVCLRCAASACRALVNDLKWQTKCIGRASLDKSSRERRHIEPRTQRLIDLAFLFFTIILLRRRRRRPTFSMIPSLVMVALSVYNIYPFALCAHSVCGEQWCFSRASTYKAKYFSRETLLLYYWPTNALTTRESI